MFTGMEAGKSFCLTLTKDAKSVECPHEKAGLPFDSITDIKTATPSDLFHHAVIETYSF